MCEMRMRTRVEKGMQGRGTQPDGTGQSWRQRSASSALMLCPPTTRSSTSISHVGKLRQWKIVTCQWHLTALHVYGLVRRLESKSAWENIMEERQVT